MLLFSQFTSMFDLIAPKLDELGISYFTLTGETKSEQRVALANRFNEGEADVFLISLKRQKNYQMHAKLFLLTER